MTLSAGTKLGPYEILSPLGAGGMGEVYKARDTRLERTVAVKVLPQHLSDSPEVRQRFEREAKTISQLSHPHICALYDVGSQDGTEYLVMELLEGETLSDRLAKGALSLEQTLRYGVEIADALDKAHRQGIVHRDLKPGNVMLTKSGVKLLDFGLAKVFEPAARKGPLTSLPTQAALTQEGTILGTFQYMAPEQLEGKDADPRTDIFAFGAVLYEMATGKKAFRASSQASLITAIMSSDPPAISTIQAMSPPALDRVVKTCLAKDPEDRWQSAGDVAKELRWIAEGSAAGVAARAVVAGRRAWRERMAWIVAALAIAAAGASLWFRPGPPRQNPIRLTIPPPVGYDFVDTVALSPDASRVMLVLRDPSGTTSLWIRPLDDLSARRIAGTERARAAFWSADGREIAFFLDGRLKRIGADGGPPQTICESGSGFTGAWGPDGTILFTKEFGTGIVAVPAAGGVPKEVTTLDRKRGEVAHFYPAFLPDGRRFVFVARNLDPEKTSIMLGSLDGELPTVLFPADSAAIYSEPGYLLFARDNALMACRFDPGAGRMIGNATALLENVRYGTEDNKISVSAARGRLTYLSWSTRRILVWVDRKGREIGTLGAIGGYEDVRISPDGRRVAVAMRDPSRGQNFDLWVLDANRGTSARVTSERTDEFNPAWSSDGQRVAYVSDHGGFYDLYARPAAGGEEKLLVRSEADKIMPSFAPDGRMLYAVAEGPLYTLWLRPAAGGEPRRITTAVRFSEDHPEFSPDGSWIAFESDESGLREVYLEPASGGSRRQVSVGGGQMPVWRRDGGELFYRTKNGTLRVVALRRAGNGLDVGDPQALFPLDVQIEGGASVSLFRRPYDAAPDGQRFLVIRSAPDAGTGAAVVVLDWAGVGKGGR